LRFELDPERLQETMTAGGGIPLLCKRSLGAPASVKQHVAVKERERGYDEATLVESFVLLNAAWGECVDDFSHLRSDAGLAALIGHEMPSPKVARKFLNAFHEEEKIQETQQRRLPDEIAYIPEENKALAGSGLVNRNLLHRLGGRSADQKIATVDQDATIIESRKRGTVYLGGVAQPMWRVGVDGCDAGRRVPGRECTGADGTVDGNQSGLRGYTQNSDDLSRSG
jgi:hypothetical protein